MSAKRTFLIAAVAVLALSGCGVQSVLGTVVQTQAVQPVAAPQRVQIEGSWQLLTRGQFVRRIDVRRVRGGIQINTPRGVFLAQRVAPRVFQDENGRIYEFFSDVDGRFENPNNGRRLRLRRL